jgi:hypothetical protein
MMVFKKLLKKYSKRYKVFVVDGKTVRDKMDVSFGLGGHDKVYKYIPQDEIWLENVKDKDNILIHELIERMMMKGGMTYNKAHRLATIEEEYFREHPKKAGKQLKELL